MDIKAEVEKILASLTKDSALKDKFMKDPIGTAKSLLGTAIPADVLDQIVAAVKAKLTGDKVADVAGKLGGLFKK